MPPNFGQVRLLLQVPLWPQLPAWVPGAQVLATEQQPPLHSVVVEVPQVVPHLLVVVLQAPPGRFEAGTAAGQSVSVVHPHA